MDEKGKHPLRTFLIQQGKTSRIQQLKVTQEKQVQQPVVNQQNMQKEKPIKEEQSKVAKEAHFFSI